MNSLVKHLSGDRRSARRYDIRTPLRYRLRKFPATEYAGESENMSEVGIFFLTDTDLRLGAIVDLVVEMPIEVNGTPMRWLHTGHVVRVEQSDSLFTRTRIGVQFGGYEVSASESSPSASAIRDFGIPHPVN